MHRNTSHHPRRSPASSLVATACVCLSLAVVGCSNEPFDFVQASGRITYEDGSPLTRDGGLRLIFVPTASPLADDVHPPSAEAFPDEQGNFGDVNSPLKGGGMVRGEQKVVVVYRDVASSRHVPKEYTSRKTTPLVVNTDDAPFDIKVPRP